MKFNDFLDCKSGPKEYDCFMWRYLWLWMDALTPCVPFSDLLALGSVMIFKMFFFYKRGLVFVYTELKWEWGSQELTKNRDPWPQQLFISSAESDRFFANCCGSLVRRYALLKKVQDGPGRWLQNLSIAFWLLLIWWWLKVRTLWQFW